MSCIIFAGSSQILATQMVHTGAPAMVIATTIAVVNIRHVLYSASISPYTQRLSRAWKMLLAYLLTDEAYAVSILHYQENESDGPGEKHWFLLGSGLALWSSWQISTFVGISLGAIVPKSWSLDFTLALTFIGLLILNVKDWPGISAVIAAGLAAVAFNALPYRVGLILAVIIGLSVAVISERMLTARRSRYG